MADSGTPAAAPAPYAPDGYYNNKVKFTTNPGYVQIFGKTAYYMDSNGNIVDIVDTLKTKDAYKKVCDVLGLDPNCKDYLAKCIADNFNKECIAALPNKKADFKLEQNDLPVYYNLLVRLGFRAENGNIISAQDWKDKVMTPKGVTTITDNQIAYLDALVKEVNGNNDFMIKVVRPRAGPAGSGSIPAALASLIRSLTRRNRRNLFMLGTNGLFLPGPFIGGAQNGGNGFSSAIAEVDSLKKEYDALKKFMADNKLALSKETEEAFNKNLTAVTAMLESLNTNMPEYKKLVDDVAKGAAIALAKDVKTPDGSAVNMGKDDVKPYDKTDFETLKGKVETTLGVLHRGMDRITIELHKNLGSKNFGVKNLLGRKNLVPGTANFQKLTSVPLTMKYIRA